MGNGRAYIQYNVKKLGLFGDDRRSVPLETVPSIRDELRGRDDRKDSKMAHFELLTEEDMAEIDRVIEEATTEIQRLRMAEDEENSMDVVNATPEAEDMNNWIQAVKETVDLFDAADRKVREARDAYDKSQKRLKELKRKFGTEFICSGVPYRITEIVHPVDNNLSVLKIVRDSSKTVIG